MKGWVGVWADAVTPIGVRCDCMVKRWYHSAGEPSLWTGSTGSLHHTSAPHAHLADYGVDAFDWRETGVLMPRRESAIRTRTIGTTTVSRDMMQESQPSAQGRRRGLLHELAFSWVPERAALEPWSLAA